MREFFAADHRAFARSGLRNKWGTSILVTFLAGLLGASGSSGFSIGFYNFGNTYSEEAAPFLIRDGWLTIHLGSGEIRLSLILIAVLSLISLALMLIGPCIRLGHSMYYIRLMRGETPEVSALFGHMRYFWRALGLSLVTGIFVFLWSLLFIIPGIVAAYRYSQAFYIMAENPDVGIMEAIRLSKEMMRGRKGRLFCLGLSFIGWSFLAALTCGIGYFWLNPYMEAAFASFYLDTAYNRFYAPAPPPVQNWQ